MGNSYSAEVWLDERRWDALEAALEEQGTNIEKYLQDYLVDLYREMVPADQVREIESCIKQERQEELREAEARKVFSVFRLWDGGKSRCLATEYPKEFLDMARLLRKCLQEGDGGTDAFARKIYGGYDISLERFNELTQERLENTGRVAGVFELDFDKKVFSAVHILDGWKSYRFQDVSTAAYQAFRKEHSSQEERWRKFVSRLEGKELTDRDLGVPLKALRDLQPGDLLFTEPANRMGRLLDFQVDCSSDTVQMEVFGPEVKCAKTGSWLDIYVSYDVARQEVRDHLDLTLHRKDGAWEKSFTYVLSPSERELLRTELEEHCQKQYRKTLNDLYAERYRQEAGTPPKLDGGSQRLDLRQVSFEGDISEYDGTLSFYMPVTFDPDAVFGTNVTSDSNGDWLNVYANYDLETGGPEQSLTVVLVCGDGNEFEFSYPLTASDREQLREKMEGYCQSQAGMSLDTNAWLALDEYGEEDFLSVDIENSWVALAFNTWDEKGNAHQYLPINPQYEESQENAPVEIGGQTPVRKRNALDNLNLAAECVLHFAQTGELYPNLKWEELDYSKIF